MLPPSSDLTLPFTPPTKNGSSGGTSLILLAGRTQLRIDAAYVASTKFLLWLEITYVTYSPVQAFSAVWPNIVPQHVGLFRLQQDCGIAGSQDYFVSAAANSCQPLALPAASSDVTTSIVLERSIRYMPDAGNVSLAQLFTYNSSNCAENTLVRSVQLVRNDSCAKLPTGWQAEASGTITTVTWLTPCFNSNVTLSMADVVGETLSISHITAPRDCYMSVRGPAYCEAFCPGRTDYAGAIYRVCLGLRGWVNSSLFAETPCQQVCLRELLSELEGRKRTQAKKKKKKRKIKNHVCCCCSLFFVFVFFPL